MMNGSAQERCHTFHNMHYLSFFTTTMSAILLIATVTMNGIIIIVCAKNKKLLHKSMFYKMLLNISIADFLTGFISDTTSISFHTKEGLVRPLVFRQGLLYWQSILILLATWVVAGLLIIPYFSIGYIRYLKIFSFATVGVTCVCLVIVTITYKRNLVLFYSTNGANDTEDEKNRERNLTQTSELDMTEEPMSEEDCFEEETAMKLPDNPAERIREKNGFIRDKSNNKIIMTINKISIRRKNNDKDIKSLNSENNGNKINKIGSIKNNSVQNSWHGGSERCRASERRVNKTFIFMLIVYLGTYLPAAVMTACLNICGKCSCVLIHTMRDLIYLMILSSAVMRPLNFVYRLQTLKNEIKLLFRSAPVGEQQFSE